MLVLPSTAGKEAILAKDACRGRKRYRFPLRQAMVELLPTDGRTRWTSMLLVLCAVLMSLSRASTLGERFEQAWNWPHRKRPKPPGTPKARNARCQKSGWRLN